VWWVGVVGVGVDADEGAEEEEEEMVGVDGWTLITIGLRFIIVGRSFDSEGGGMGTSATGSVRYPGPASNDSTRSCEGAGKTSIARGLFSAIDEERDVRLIGLRMTLGFSVDTGEDDSSASRRPKTNSGGMFSPNVLWSLAIFLRFCATVGDAGEGGDVGRVLPEEEEEEEVREAMMGDSGPRTESILPFRFSWNAEGAVVVLMLSDLGLCEAGTVEVDVIVDSELTEDRREPERGVCVWLSVGKARRRSSMGCASV
jgi:hypothetical protein